MKGIKFRCRKLPHRSNTSASGRLMVRNLIAEDNVAEIGRPTDNRKAKKERPVANAKKTMVMNTRSKKVAVAREKDILTIS